MDLLVFTKSLLCVELYHFCLVCVCPGYNISCAGYYELTDISYISKLLYHCSKT